MQLFEVKNDIAKIIYNPADNHLLPSDFVLIEDVNQKLIAQIINISTTENSNNNIADARLSLSIDNDDNLSFYNGYIPIKSSDIVYINPDEIIELLQGNENIYFGNLANHLDCFVKLPLSFINDKLYIQSDRNDKTKIIIQNIITELYLKQKKIILLDFCGTYNSVLNVPRLKISENFKLPLNIEAFNNILDFDITDCPIEDKAVIHSIVLELREYIKTIENRFLPFTLFKNVIDNEFKSNPIPGLMQLRNKLWLYAQENIFAESKSQFQLINDILEKQNLIIIDASNLEEKWYKFTIMTILDIVDKYCCFALSLNDVPLDKKTIISLYNKSNITPIISTSYDSKYRQILKSICKNQILLKPANLINEKEAYCTLLNKTNSDEFILYGDSTLYLPLILELKSFDSSTNDNVVQNDIKKDVNKFLSSKKDVRQKIPTKELEITSAEISYSPDIIQNSETDSNPENTAEIENTLPADNIEEPDIILQSDIQPDSEAEVKENLISETNNKFESIKPIDDVSENISSTLDEIFDDDFNSSDFEFLDEQEQEQLTIDDLRNNNQNNDPQDKSYDIFDPIPLEDEEVINISEQNETVILEENSIIENDNTEINEKINEDLKTETEENQPDSQSIPSGEIISSDIQNSNEQNAEIIDIIEIKDNNENSDLKENNITEDIEQPKDVVLEMEEESTPTLQNQNEELIEPAIEPEIVHTDFQPEDELRESADILKDSSVIEQKKETVSEPQKILTDENEEENQKIEIEIDEDDVNIVNNSLNQEENELEIKIEQSEQETENIDLESEKDYQEETIEEHEITASESEDEIISIDDVIDNITSKIDENQNNNNLNDDENENKEADKESSNNVQEVNNNNDGIQQTVKQEPPSLNKNININKNKETELTVYETDNTANIQETEIPFKIGDKVYHPKHGNGIVEGFANYSNKILFCQIEFENVGRRILDPRISNIQKIS